MTNAIKQKIALFHVQLKLKLILQIFEKIVRVLVTDEHLLHFMDNHLILSCKHEVKFDSLYAEW